ncbi:zinc knuckle CX2CX4HX4C containing protein [Tanacetum coccineum]
MRDPESKNSSSSMPAKASDEFIKPKKITHSSIGKPQLSTGMKLSRRVSFKASKGNISAKGMEGLVFGDDESEGSVDSRSCGDSVSEKDAQADLVKNMVSDLGNKSFKVDNVSEVNDSGLGIRDKLGPMPVPVDEDPILSSRLNTMGSTRILKRGEVLSDGGYDTNVADTVNRAEKWPKVGSTSAMNDETMGENGDGRKASSFVNAVQGMSKSGNNKLKLIPGRINELGKEVVDMDPVIEEGSKAWVMTLVGYFVGLKMSHREILGHLRRMWRAYHLDEIIMNECGLYFFKFKSDEGMQFVLENGPWLVDEAWNVEGISRIASRIGNPIIMDRITTSMCEKAYGRASFAHVLVEVEAAKGLVDSVEVCYKALGRSMELRVEYPWRPPVCSHCKVFGHNDDKCTSRVLTDAERIFKRLLGLVCLYYEVAPQMYYSAAYRIFGGVTNDGGNTGVYRQRFSSGEGSSRGGFAGRGRGGFGGRGFGDQRFFRNENVQFVPVNKGKEPVNVVGAERGKKNKGTSRMEVDSDNNNSRMINNVGSGKKINKKDGTSSENRFATLSKEIEIEENLEYDYLKAKIDEACEKGIYISMQEKKEWPG